MMLRSRPLRKPPPAPRIVSGAASAANAAQSDALPFLAEPVVPVVQESGARKQYLGRTRWRGRW